MECILCNGEIPASDAVCDPCASAVLKDSWYVAGNAHEGTRRLLQMTDAVAIIDGNGYTVTLGGEDAGSRFRSLPQGAAGYYMACLLFNELMKGMGQKTEGDFVPPPYGFMKDAIGAIDGLENSLEGKGSQETYGRLALLYEAASRHFNLPYVSEHFIRSKKEHLEGRAAFWRSKLSADGKAGQEISVIATAAESMSAGSQSADSAGVEFEHFTATQTAATEVIARRDATAAVYESAIGSAVEQLRKKMTVLELELQAARETEREKAAAGQEKDEAGQPLFVRNMRRRAYLHYLAYSFDKAYSEVSAILEEGVGTEHDYKLASLLALRTGRGKILKDIAKSARSRSIALDDTLLRAVVDWKEGSWGRALQLSEREMRKGSYSAGFILKKSICEQYNLRERQEELETEGAKIPDLQKGIDMLSGVLLSVGTWGAALQTMANSEKSEWTAETWTNMGIALEEKGDMNGAEDAYSNALEMNGKLLPAIVRQALLQCKMGKHALSLETLKDARQLEPAIFRLQANELVELGRKKDALALLQKLMGQDQDDLESASLGLRLSMELGNADSEKIFRLYVHRREKPGGE